MVHKDLDSQRSTIVLYKRKGKELWCFVLAVKFGGSNGKTYAENTSFTSCLRE